MLGHILQTVLRKWSKNSSRVEVLGLLSEGKKLRVKDMKGEIYAERVVGWPPPGGL